jgi:hypothetical protein
MKGTAERRELYVPDVLMVVAFAIGEVQVLVLSPQRYAGPVPSRIFRDTVVPL